MWMERPLPPVLLDYAAHDIEIIARVYARFESRAGRSNKKTNLFYNSRLSELKIASARYVGKNTSRAQRAHFSEIGLSRFLPFEVLDPPPKHAGRYSCFRCEQWLSLPCFSTEKRGLLRWRLSFCRLCALLARKGLEDSLGELVVVL